MPEPRSHNAPRQVAISLGLGASLGLLSHFVDHRLMQVTLGVATACSVFLAVPAYTLFLTLWLGRFTDVAANIIAIWAAYLAASKLFWHLGGGHPWGELNPLPLLFFASYLALAGAARGIRRFD